MKRILITYRIVAVAMALLIGMTSIGMTINMHFCGGSLRSVSLLQGSDSCCSAAKSCDNFKETTPSDDKKCCDNQLLQVQSDDDFIIDQVKVISDIEVVSSLATNSQAFDHLNISLYNAADFQHYKPPLIPRDIPVLFESFLL